MKKEAIIFAEKSTHKLFKDLQDQKFTRLCVLGYAGKFGNGKEKRHHWWCECDCLDKTIIKVDGGALVSQITKSCGCLRTERLRERMTTHGMKNSSEYASYNQAKDRCENYNCKNYQHYGGRGIEFRFNNFEEFYAELGDKPEPKEDFSIERMNNNGHYEVGNIRWATKTEQARNRRSNHLITINGQTKTIKEYSEMSSIKYQTILMRINKYGWCNYCSVTIPANVSKNNNLQMRCIHKDN